MLVLQLALQFMIQNDFHQDIAHLWNTELQLNFVLPYTCIQVPIIRNCTISLLWGRGRQEGEKWEAE